MPRLENPRWEKFCQAYVRGETVGNAAASYEAVYGKADRHAASRLQRRDNIAQRIAELQDQVAKVEAEATAMVAKRRAITIDSLIDEADALKKAALEVKQVAPAVSALTLKAKLAGFLTERRVVENPMPPPTAFVDLPPHEAREEWLARQAAMARGEPYCTGRRNERGEAREEWEARRRREIDERGH